MPDTFAERARRFAKRLQEKGDAAISYPSTVVKPQPPEQQAQNALTIMKARNDLDTWATPKAFWVEHNVPGMKYAADAMRRLDESHRDQQPAPVDAGEMDEPGVRQPIQMQREFSNDAEKEAYLDRIRAAQRNAAK